MNTPQRIKCQQYKIIFQTSSVYAVILCTILLSQLDQGKYVIQIDILPKEKAEEKKKKRREKGFVSKADVFMGGGKSKVFKVNVDSVITFQTDGALKPMTEFKQVRFNPHCFSYILL